METRASRTPTASAGPLETFLSGMETGDRPERQRAGGCLETFLSGMETHLAEHLDQRGILLETFLSGMETNLSQIYNIRKNSLKPSLVEWKPASSSILGVRTKEP